MQNNPPINIKTLKFRIKDKHAKVLNSLARDVNFVWNFCNDLSFKVFQKEKKFLSGFDIQKYTNGATKEGLNLHSTTVQSISSEYAIRRKQFKKVKLNWRKSFGSKKSLGWVPFKASGIKYINGQIHYLNLKLSFWDSYDLSKYMLSHDITVGSFNEDSQGKWYCNITLKAKEHYKEPVQLSLFNEPILDKEFNAVGIDLGLKELMTLSDGSKIPVNKYYRKTEAKIKIAHRTRKSKKVKKLHAKIKNQRKDSHHKISSALVKTYTHIYIGNVSSKKLGKTNLAKSVYDAGWSQLKSMLQYKSQWTGSRYEELNEAYSTQSCSCCGARTGPKGRRDLVIREWKCICGAAHDRDINSAKNILACGHARLVAGIPFL